MALAKDQLKWRIRAAAALHGHYVKDLPDLLEKFGADRHLAAGLMDGRIEPRRAKLDQLASFFGVPVQFFEDEKWEPTDTYTMTVPDASVGLRRQQEGLLKLDDIIDRLERLEGQATESRDRLDRLVERVAEGLGAAAKIESKLDGALTPQRPKQPQARQRGSGGS